jgi:suppressor of ftsI/bilirubin oxidase
MNRISRRRFIAAGAATAAAAGLAGGVYWWWRDRGEPAGHDMQAMPPAAEAGAFANPLRLPGTDGLFGVLDVPVPLTIVGKTIRHPILPGKPAPLLAFEVEHDGKTFLNPVLRVRSGAALRVKFWNALDETSIIHWHGLHVDSNNDGHPHYAVPGGATYDYQFTVANRSGTYWYHPHPHGLTGKQVYLGMAGLFIIEDADEIALREKLDLKFGVTDVPLVLQDRRFTEAGELAYQPSQDEIEAGLVGDTVLVNLTASPYFDTAHRIVRFRILNGSNARNYRLAFMQGNQPLPYYVIGTDGGLLERAVKVTEAFISAAERLDVLLDLRAADMMRPVMLKSLAFDPMHNEAAGESAAGAMPHVMAGGGMMDGMEISLLKINIKSSPEYKREIPSHLSSLPAAAVDGASERPLKLDIDEKRRWRINGLTFDMGATPITVKRGSKEIWVLQNATRSMPHPMHVHGFQFRVLERRGSPQQISHLALNAQGLLPSDLGWKDTVLVWPGETVRIALDFTHPFHGDQVYMLHCHNLEHEDQGMMLNFKVT